jgi:ribosome-binding protein aMBF1 (putative translation factor)
MNLKEKILKQCDELKSSLIELEMEANAQSYISIDDFGKTVKWKRQINNMTQEQLAELAGISLSCLKRIEKTNRNVNLDNLLKVLDVLGIKAFIK